LIEARGRLLGFLDGGHLGHATAARGPRMSSAEQRTKRRRVGEHIGCQLAVDPDSDNLADEFVVACDRGDVPTPAGRTGRGTDARLTPAIGGPRPIRKPVGGGIDTRVCSIPQGGGTSSETSGVRCEFGGRCRGTCRSTA
jgi:hypothetical protein